MKRNIIIILIATLFIIGAFSVVVAEGDYVEVKLKPGETFMEICQREVLDCKINWRTILKYNGMRRPTDAIPNNTLKIPNSLSIHRYATVPFVMGIVEVYNEKSEGWTRIRDDYVLVEGNIVRTGDDAKCEVKLDDGTVLKMGADTHIALGEFDFEDGKSDTLLKMFKGSVLMKITKLGNGDSFNVDTVSAVAGVRGTEFSVEVNNDTADAKVEVTVIEGKVGARAKKSENDKEEIVFGTTTASETSAESIAGEGGRTDINEEKTIEVSKGYTLQFNWEQEEAIVTQVPEQITSVEIEEIEEVDEDGGE